MVEVESLFIPQSPALCADHHPGRRVTLLSPGPSAGPRNRMAACRFLRPAPLEGAGVRMGAGSPLPAPGPVCLTSQACISGVVSACSVGFLCLSLWGAQLHRGAVRSGGRVSPAQAGGLAAPSARNECRSRPAALSLFGWTLPAGSDPG